MVWSRSPSRGRIWLATFMALTSMTGSGFVLLTNAHTGPHHHQPRGGSNTSFRQISGPPSATSTSVSAPADDGAEEIANNICTDETPSRPIPLQATNEAVASAKMPKVCWKPPIPFRAVLTTCCCLLYGLFSFCVYPRLTNVSSFRLNRIKGRSKYCFCPPIPVVATAPRPNHWQNSSSFTIRAVPMTYSMFGRKTGYIRTKHSWNHTNTYQHIRSSGKCSIIFPTRDLGKC